MDLLSHALIGGLVASAGLHQKYGLAASATVVAASLIPDLDGVSALLGPENFFKYHRGPLTHSIGGAIIQSAALTAIVYLATPLKQPWLLFAISLIGAMLHLLSDLLTPWQIPLLWPFSSKTFSLDLIYFLDPFLLVVLGAGFLAANYWSARGALFLSLTLALVVGYLGFRVYGQQTAVRLVRERTSSDTIVALPHGLSVATWDVIAQAGVDYAYYIIDPFQRIIKQSQIIHSVRDERVLLAESKSTLAQAFLRRARFPVTFVSNAENRTTIEWRDAHLMQSGGGVRGAKVVLDESGKILEEKFELNVRN